MRRAAWILVLAGALPALAQGPDSKQSILSDLWRRRVLAPDKNEWTPADLLLLQRMRRAENEDACGFLRAKVHGLRGLAVYIRDPQTRETHLRLTKDGFDKYLFLRSQDALAYFQAHDASYKWAFLLKDMDGSPLFDSTGRLTDAGQTVYDRLLANLEAHYRLPDGRIGGNRAPPKPDAPAPEPEVSAPVYRRPMTQAPPEAASQPAEPSASQPPAGEEPPPRAPGSGSGAGPEPGPQSASQPPPDEPAPPQQAPGPAPQDSD